MMGKLFLKNIVFTILQPGIVVVLIPYLLTRLESSKNTFPRSLQNLGIAICILGILLFILSLSRFIVEGKGTISPASPTKELINKGVYRYSRNPMYVAMLLILMGTTLRYSSVYLIFYSVFVLFAFHFFIIKIEEPRLIRDFGKDYLKYCERVNRWI